MLKSAIALYIAFTLTSALANNDTPVLDQKQENQAQRIERGVESGQLNQREAARMEHAADRLEANEAKAKEDGTMTARERRRLHREAKANSARIARQKHDGQGSRTRDHKARR